MKPKRIWNENMLDWPNCSVADCDAKVWCAGGSDKCFPHTHGLTPVPREEYQRTGKGWREDITYEDVLKAWDKK